MTVNMKIDFVGKERKGLALGLNEFAGISINETAFLKALHPGIWGFLQLATGPLSDSLYKLMNNLILSLTNRTFLECMGYRFQSNFEGRGKLNNCGNGIR